MPDRPLNSSGAREAVLRYICMNIFGFKVESQTNFVVHKIIYRYIQIGYIIYTYMHHIYFIKYTPFSRNPIELRRKLE